MLDTLTLACFAPHLGETFRVHVRPEQAVDMELVEARSLGTAAMKKREPFSLLFKGPTTAVLPQRIYRIEHDGVGGHDLFIVPVGPGQGGLLYEAIFT
jgi:hypothetical protein